MLGLELTEAFSYMSEEIVKNKWNKYWMFKIKNIHVNQNNIKFLVDTQINK